MILRRIPTNLYRILRQAQDSTLSLSKGRITTNLILVGLLFIYATYLYAMGTRPPHKYIPIRVLVVRDALEVNLRIKGSYKIVDFGKGEVVREGSNLRGFAMSTEDIDSEGIKILSGKRARLYINNRQFRGEIDIIKNGDTKLLVVNHIDVEEYLYGVLYHEVSHRWPMEVLKAQAIAARTYALYQKLVSKNKYFDLTADIFSQVYGGRRSETWRTTAAVNLTQGQVLTYIGKVFPSYYHAACGGRTSRASTIWDIDIPTLRGRACNFCKSSPHYRWKKELSMDYIEREIEQSAHKIHIVSIEVMKRDESGRVLNMVLRGKNGNLSLRGNKFRLSVGPNTIKSTNFEIQTKGKYITFYGKGWGHGIGMCQWGAYNMARNGWKADEILEYYYPGAEITQLE